jgi:hypothetical protein
MTFSHFPVRTDAFGHGVLEWVGPLEISLVLIIT